LATNLGPLRSSAIGPAVSQIPETPMSAQTGLQRRRVAATSSSHDPDDDQDTASSRPATNANQSTISHSNSFQDSNGIRSTHAGTALAGGSKVAYDPRDLGGGEDEAGAPKLTLLEEILLLGIKDRAVSICQLGMSELVAPV
jgi:golgi phosphoprotein 3